MIRPILIAINILLGCILMFAAGKRLMNRSAADSGDRITAVKKVPKNKITAVVRPSIPVVSAQVSDSEKLERVLQNNVFNQERCPTASNPFSGNNTRLELSLVGTFSVGKLQGAIIMQKGAAQQQMPFAMPQFMNNNSNWNNRRGGTSGRFGGNGGMDGNNPQNRMMSAMQMMPPGMMPQFTNQNNGAATPTGAANGALKQYVKLGETLANGYTLTEVGRDKVTLIKGSDKLVLELLDPSKNAPKVAEVKTAANNQQKAATAARQAWQQRQQQETQMRQNMLQTMQNLQNQVQQMNNNGNNNPSDRSGVSTSGNTRNSSSSRNSSGGRSSSGRR